MNLARKLAAGAIAAGLTTAGVLAATPASATVVPSAQASVAPPAQAKVAQTETVKAGVVKVVHMSDGTLTVSLGPEPRIKSFSAHGCNGYLAEACFYISGSGLYVSSMHTDAQNHEDFTVMMRSVVKNSPAGHIYADTGFVATPSGWQMTATWTPLNTEPAGKYCGVAIANTGHSGTACESVYS